VSSLFSIQNPLSDPLTWSTAQSPSIVALVYSAILQFGLSIDMMLSMSYGMTKAILILMMFSSYVWLSLTSTVSLYPLYLYKSIYCQMTHMSKVLHSYHTHSWIVLTNLLLVVVCMLMATNACD
jgi:hypothetical protein